MSGNTWPIVVILKRDSAQESFAGFRAKCFGARIEGSRKWVNTLMDLKFWYESLHLVTADMFVLSAKL